MQKATTKYNTARQTDMHKKLDETAAFHDIFLFGPSQVESVGLLLQLLDYNNNFNHKFWICASYVSLMHYPESIVI